MKILIALLFVALPVTGHENLVTAGYVFDDGITLGYHRVHKQTGEWGFYGNIFYGRDTDNYSQLGSVTSETIETSIVEFVTVTVTTSETTYHRAIKCTQHGKCHEYGPSIPTTTITETTTVEPVTTTTYEAVSTSNFEKTKRKTENLILNLGVNYSLREDIFVYAGLGALKENYKVTFSDGETSYFERESDKHLNVNLGLIFNDNDGYGLDVGYNTATKNLYLGLSYEF